MAESSVQPEIENNEEMSTGAKIGIALGVLVLVAAVVGGVVFLLQDAERTENIRNIFVIFMVLELLLSGVVTVLLIVQIAKLVNMFQHEIKPVLDSANETMSTIRGTAVFMSDSMVQPVIKLNSYFASVKKFLDLLNIDLTKFQNNTKKE